MSSALNGTPPQIPRGASEATGEGGWSYCRGVTIGQWSGHCPRSTPCLRRGRLFEWPQDERPNPTPGVALTRDSPAGGNGKDSRLRGPAPEFSTSSGNDGVRSGLLETHDAGGGVAEDVGSFGV